MGYKFKPAKAVAKRFRVSKNGKLKHNHSLTSHLRSGRSGNLKRRLRRASVLFEGHAKNMRYFMGLKGLRPTQIAHERALKEKAKQAEATAAA